MIEMKDGKKILVTPVSAEDLKDIKIGDSIQKVFDVYGSDWMRCEDEYRYYIGNSYMYFYVQNGIVANIGYSFDNELE